MLSSTSRCDLHEAALQGRRLQLEKLIQRGGNVNLLSEDDDIPLHDACLSGSLACVKLLINHGAKVNTVNIWGRTPLYNCCWFGSGPICRELLNKGADMYASNLSCLVVSIEKGHVDCVRELLQHGFDPDSVPHAHTAEPPPLHLACVGDNYEILVLLLQHGARCQYADEFGAGTSALHAAARNDRARFVEALVLAGCPPRCRDNKQLTPKSVAHFDSATYRALERAEREPLTLKQTCRISIFNNLCDRKVENVYRLNLPNELLTYLSWNDCV